MSPFVSKAQRGYLFSKKPALAKEFESKTPKGKKLPYHRQKSALKKMAAKSK